MADATDMSTPMTRGELRAEIAPLATKVELELWGGALLARLDAVEHRLLAELARHTRATFESMSTQISVIDEKYADLPYE